MGDGVAPYQEVVRLSHPRHYLSESRWCARRRVGHAVRVEANLAHFSINADDVEGARSFYQAIFDWRFEAWGPPEFYLITTGESGIRGSLQRRRELVEGQPMLGLEGTFAVDDVDRIARSVVANGGVMLMEKTRIASVGDLIWFRDPAGNAVGAMRYDPDAE
jgi:predicted enzyme related to lactoylglutathione lyase